MSRLLLNIGLSLGLVLFSASPASSCGDKLLVLGRGVRFQDISASHHLASILLYAPAGSQTADTITDPQLLSALRKAGHAVRLIEDRNRLEEAIKTGGYDLLLVALGDASNLENQIAPSSGTPLIVPVMYQGSKADSDLVQQRFHCLLKTPAKGGKYLSVIDRAMELKAKRERNAIRPSK